MSTIADCKEGDEVALYSSYGHEVKIRRIERTTRTMVFVDGIKFNRHGSQIGGGIYSKHRIAIPTEKSRAKARELWLREWARSLPSGRAPLDVLEAMYQVYKQAMTASENERRMG